MPATDIDLRGDDPLSRAREHLKIVDLDPERVRRVRVVVEYDDEPAPDGAERWDGATTDVDEPGGLADEGAGGETEEKASSPEVERGPVEASGSGGGAGGGGRRGPGEHAYKGSRWEGAVTPDSNRGEVLRSMVDGGWYSRSGLAEATDLSTKQAGRAVTDLFRDYGYTERRGDVKNREYRITDEGRTAIEKGIRKVRTEHDEPDFVDEATDDTETICGNCGETHDAAFTRCPTCGTPA